MAEPADNVRISVHTQPAREDALAVHEFLRRHNESRFGVSDRAPLTAIARAADGAVVGGVLAETMHGWLHLATLAVAEEWRGKGIGTALLRAVENEGRMRGCSNVWLDTFSFQAQPFYERDGCRVFGVLEDFPPGETRYFMTKALVTGWAQQVPRSLSRAVASPGLGRSLTPSFSPCGGYFWRRCCVLTLRSSRNC